MKTFALGITTYLKNDSLDKILSSVINLGKQIESVCVADDAAGHALPIVQKYQEMYEKGEYPFPLSYCRGETEGSGVARNKNRNIKWFLEHSKADYLILSDDDISFVQSSYRFGDKYFLDHIQKIFDSTGLHHLLTYISWGNDPLSGNPYMVQFPPHGEDEYLYYLGGAQGIFLVFTREAVQKAGYMPVWKRYGYEHIAYSAAVNRIFGRAPTLFPVIKTSNQYFSCNNCPNNYEVNKKDLEYNGRKWEDRHKEILAGIDLRTNRWD